MEPTAPTSPGRRPIVLPFASPAERVEAEAILDAAGIARHALQDERLIRIDADAAGPALDALRDGGHAPHLPIIGADEPSCPDCRAPHDGWKGRPVCDGCGRVFLVVDVVCDMSSFSTDGLRCRCGYELTGLPPERPCPECGLSIRFDLSRLVVDDVAPETAPRPGPNWTLVMGLAGLAAVAWAAAVAAREWFFLPRVPVLLFTTCVVMTVLALFALVFSQRPVADTGGPRDTEASSDGGGAEAGPPSDLP